MIAKQIQKERNSEFREINLMGKLSKAFASAGLISLLIGVSSGFTAIARKDNYKYEFLPANHYRDATMIKSDIQEPLAKYKEEIKFHIGKYIAQPFIHGGETSILLGLFFSVCRRYSKSNIKNENIV